MAIIITQNEGLPPYRVMNRYSGVIKYRPDGVLSYDSNSRYYYYALRSSSASYIAKPEVRRFVFNRDSHTCVYCGATENLTVDHVTSIYSCAFENALPVEMVNHVDNLQTLCKSCNSRKTT